MDEMKYEKHLTGLPGYDELHAVDPGEVSDGYHTFNELYAQRAALLALVCNGIGGWKSRLHDDGTMFSGMFIIGWETELGPVTFHIEDYYWSTFTCEELDKAPKWDGYTSKEVVNRILEQARGYK